MLLRIFLAMMADALRHFEYKPILCWCFIAPALQCIRRGIGIKAAVALGTVKILRIVAQII